MPEQENKIFSSIISLGSHCEPSDHYRRFFKQEPSSPFDWMITPIPSLIKILEDDGAQFGLGITPAMDATSALCINYGCYYHHEFDKTSDNKIIVTEQALKNCRDKLSHKYRKMISIAKETKPLFIRWIHPAERPADSSAENFIFTSTQVKRLMELIQLKLGHDDFHIAFIKTVENPHQIMDENLSNTLSRNSVHSYSEATKEIVNQFWDQFYIQYGFNKPDAI